MKTAWRTELTHYSYADHYHQFLPIVPTFALQSSYIPYTIKSEPFLVTAILVIAVKNLPDLAYLRKPIWDHMRQLILDVVLGMTSTRGVGCVEGLLLLGEWAPLNHGQSDDGGEGAAWSILGLAVRLAYLLRLENRSFKVGCTEPSKRAQRERLAWTCTLQPCLFCKISSMLIMMASLVTYLCDRQISIRMGQAFWCRGPSLSARFTAKDFPSLQPQQAGNEDFASLVQAQVELTTIFGNAHDILFASRSRTAELMTRGDYTKYIDDTNRAMASWKNAWRSISVSPHLRTTLNLAYEYLRLYVNAFAFQAVLYRNSRNTGTTSTRSINEPQTSNLFPDSTMASPDARYIYETVDAAETLIKMVTEDLDPTQHVRYMPSRFYL